MTEGGPTAEVASRASESASCCPVPPTEAETRRLVALYRSARSSLAATRPVRPPGDQADRPAPRGDGCRRRGRLDGRRQRAPEPRRNPREALNATGREPMNPIHSLDRLADQTRRHFLREGSLGLGGSRWRDARRTTIRRGERRRSTTRSRPGRRTFRRRSRTSSS